MIAPVEAEQEGGESRFLDHDGRVPRIDPANLPFILLFPRRQGRGYVQWIYYDVYEVEVRLTAFPVQKAANWLLSRFACYSRLLLRLDPGRNVIFVTLHGPPLRYGPAARGPSRDEADFKTAFACTH